MEQKPAYRDRFPCASCGVGYLDCMQQSGYMCCKRCDGHPERFALGSAAYDSEEIADMRRRAGLE